MPARRVAHPLLTAIGALAVAYFALWACAPVTALRPPTPMGDDLRHELTLGGAWVEPLDAPAEQTGVWAGQLSYVHHFRGDRVNLGGGLFAGTASLVGGGVFFRYNAVQGEKFRFAVDVNGGWLWAEVAAPMSFHLGGRSWLYVAPGGGARMTHAVRLPVGVAIGLGDHVVLSPELAVGYGGVGGELLTSWAGFSASGALGISGRF